MMKEPTHSHTHCQVARKSPPHYQNLSLSMSLPTLTEMLTKLKEIEGMKKAQQLTKAIRNAGKVLFMNIIAINKISSKLKINYFKIPNYA